MALKYTKMSLDRRSNQRTNPQWLSAQLKRVETRFLVVDQGLHLYDKQNEVVKLSPRDLGEVKTNTCIFLGLDGETPIFSIAFNQLTPERQSELVKEYQFIELRAVVHSLTDEQAAIQGLSKALHYWHSTHQYCGRCGSANTLIDAGHSRKCTNTECAHITFPRTDPAVIMVVEHTFPDGITRCLLGRQSNWPEGGYSTLAGFVDPGESLEEAVIRETKEETGVSVKNVQYLGSQPWPFPSSVMLGFIAEACSPELNIDKDEIEHAQWFSREELDAFGEWHDDSPGFKKTRKESISRALLDMWHYQKPALHTKEE